MSYCRFSTDDFQCDVYVYASASGGYTVHFASSKRIIKEPMPPYVEFTQENITAYMERHNEMMRIVGDAEMVPIGLPFDGKTINGDVAEVVVTLELARKEGYRFPADDVIAAIIADGENPPTEDP